MDVNITYGGTLERIERQPGDIFVLTVDQIISAEQMERLRTQAEKDLGCTVIVLSKGMKLSSMSLNGTPMNLTTEVLAIIKQDFRHHGPIRVAVVKAVAGDFFNAMNSNQTVLPRIE